VRLSSTRASAASRRLLEACDTSARSTSRRCYEVIAVSIFREGSRPSGCPRPMRRGWLRRNRLLKPSGALILCRRVFAFLPLAPHFSGEVSERRPWVFKREDRPADFAGRSKSRILPRGHPDAYTSEYPIPITAHHIAGSTPTLA
jgi:hypothetical protein